MARASQRGPVPGPAFIRQLARLTDAQIPQPTAALSDRLGQWVDWNRALVLSKALDGALPDADTSAPPFEEAVEQECARARAALVERIVGDPLPAPPKPRDQDVPAAADYAPFRQHYQSLQRAMLGSTGRLRGRLRDMLAQQSEDKARLAEVDAVMEMTLSPREQSLLGRLPDLLGEHFQRLRPAAAEARDTDTDADPAPAAQAAPEAWLLTFHADMRQALLGELEVRFHPIEALLAALRTP